MSNTKFVCPFTIKCEPGAIRFDTTLMFTFNPIKGGAWKNYTVVWKTVPFVNTPHLQIITLVYTSQLGFGHPQVSKGKMLTPGVNVKTSAGYKTTLIRDGQNFSFTKPAESEGANQSIIAQNTCPSIEPISIGFFDDAGEKYTPALLFEHVPQDQSVVAEFTPVLQCYASSQYKEMQFIKGDIEGSIGWERNLTQVTPDSVFTLTQNFQTGKCTLKLEE